jgi:hypothetical protein
MPGKNFSRFRTDGGGNGHHAGDMRRAITVDETGVELGNDEFLWWLGVGGESEPDRDHSQQVTADCFIQGDSFMHNLERRSKLEDASILSGTS